MLNGTHFSGDVNSEMDLRTAFINVRMEAKRTQVATSLVDLYKLAGFLTALTDAPCWKMKVGGAAHDYGILCREEFRITARAINERAEQIGCELRFNEMWPRSLSCAGHELARSRSLAR